MNGADEKKFVLLDGEYVPASTINPAKHRFIGMFRPALNPIANPTTYVLCQCGQMLKYRGEEETHYRKGCFDINQYIVIKEKTL